MEILPQIIIYVVTGFVFIKTFHFVALKQNSSDIEHTLTTSLVIGYIYCNIAYLIPFSISYEIDTLGIVLSALVLGYVSAILLKNQNIISILDFLKIRDTGNLYYWDDIMDTQYPMKVKVVYENAIYEGMLHNFESYSNEPHIVMASYVEFDGTGRMIKDYISDNTRIIILDTSTAISVEIIYAKDSTVCADVNKLCTSNKNLFYIKRKPKNKNISKAVD